MSTAASFTSASPADTLRANLDALRRTDPDLAAALAAAAPAPLDWSTARNGQPTAAYTPPGSDRPQALTSKYDPDAEAGKLLGNIDFAKTACLVLLGLGLGYHLQPALDAVGDEGLVLLYEPDPALLRAVLERRDLADLLARPQVVVLTGESIDRADLLRRTEHHAARLTQGTHLVTLPFTRRRHPAALQAFSQQLTDVVAFCRTNIATALVNASRTCRNLVNNLAVYAAGATTNELHRAAAGYPAVCVGAGPSLVKNVHLLADSAVRANVVVIAVQTALKPLLDRGITPDFVTALDYSPICARFYEGLPELPHTTLVAEPKANAAILRAFPGPVRVTQSTFNDQILGRPDDATLPAGGLARPITPIKGGATVAHLSFYLAQHLGCDPILFIGQDLGFSDGLYYAPGTAVHQVWDCELNPFNTIEMMEWQRIVRMRGHLRRFEDVHGRPLFSDEQMLTYLKQFERDFADAQAQGTVVIDATEGGMPKEHTRRQTLAQALAQHATRPVPSLPLPGRTLDADRLARLDGLVQSRRESIRELQQMSRDSLDLLRRMQRAIENRDQPRLDRLFVKLEHHRKRVETDLQAPFAIVNQLNTIGTYRRHRADRAIAQDVPGADPLSKLSQQILRDRDNIDWIVQACDEALDILNLPPTPTPGSTAPGSTAPGNTAPGSTAPGTSAPESTASAKPSSNDSAPLGPEPPGLTPAA
ncbi:MAG: 6-hydroxymethylpterin diphosphokinase MptE-like protein [Planctomycetota bacterium]